MNQGDKRTICIHITTQSQSWSCVVVAADDAAADVGATSVATAVCGIDAVCVDAAKMLQYKY